MTQSIATVDSSGGVIVAPPKRAWRLKALVAAHVLVGPLTAGVAYSVSNTSFPQLEPWFDAMSWSVQVAQVAILAFWLAMGSHASWKRLAAFVAGCAVVAGWPLAPPMIIDGEWANETLLGLYVRRLAAYFAIGILQAGILLIARSSVAELRLAPQTALAQHRWQFSLLHLLIFISTPTLIFTLARASSAADASNALTILALIFSIAFAWLFLPLFVALGTLTPGRVPWRLALALLMAAIVGIAAKNRGGEFPEFIFSISAVGVFAVIFLTASLAVVRSCGYRLVHVM